MSGRTSGQGDDGDHSKSSDPSPQIDTPLVRELDTQEAGEENNIPETTENDDKSGDGSDDEDDEGDEDEDDEGDDEDEDDEDDENEENGEYDEDEGDKEGEYGEPSTPNRRTSRKRAAGSPAKSQLSAGRSNWSGRTARLMNDAEPVNTEIVDPLASIAAARSQLFNSLLARIRNEAFYESPEALAAAVVLADMPGREAARWWNADYIQSRSMRRIEGFRQANARPRDDGTVLSIVVQNQILEQLQGLSFVLQEDAMRWLVRGLRTDTVWTSQMIESINHLLGDRSRSVATSRAPSAASNITGPEPVRHLLDRQSLWTLPRQDLVSIILQQDEDRRNELDQYEENVKQATAKANSERNEAQTALTKLTAITQQLRLVANDHGRHNRDVEGQPLQAVKNTDGHAEDQPEDGRRYTDTLESALQDCREAREKDGEILKHLRLEIAGLNANLVEARAEARQAREQADDNHPDEHAEPLPAQELPAAPPSQVSSTTDREPLRDTDAELEALRAEHRQELARLRADCAKEISDLREDFDDQCRTYENRQQSLTADGESLPDQERYGSGGSVSSEAIERLRSGQGRFGENDGATGVSPVLENLLDSLWGDDDESSDFMAIADQQYQQVQSSRTKFGLTSEYESTSESGSEYPSQQDSPSGSADRPISITAASEKTKLENRIQVLTTANNKLRRRVNTLEQISEGCKARNRQLEGTRDTLQNTLEETVSREKALQQQVAELEQRRNSLQQTFPDNRVAIEQHVADLRRARNKLQLELTSSHSSSDSDEEDFAAVPLANEVLQLRADDLEAAHKVLRDELVAERNAYNTLRQDFANVDKQRAILQATVDNDFVEYQGFQNDNADLRFQVASLDQTLRRTTQERENARAEIDTVRTNLQNAEDALQTTIEQRNDAVDEATKVTNNMQQAIAEAQNERNQAHAELRNTLDILGDRGIALQNATVEGNASQRLLTDLQQQLRDCQELRAAEGLTPAVNDPEQAVNLVERLLRVINGLRQFTPHANEVAQFANAMVQAGRIEPATLGNAFQRVTDLAANVAWPDADFSITPEQRGDIGQLTEALEAWLPTIELAIDDSVRLTTAVGSLRLAVNIWNTFSPPEPGGSQPSSSANPDSERGSLQAGPPSDRSSNANTTSSFSTREKGELLNIAARVADLYVRGQRGNPIDEAQALDMAGQAADLYIRRFMGGQEDQDDNDEVESRSTGSRGSVRGSGRGGSRPEGLGPIHVDPEWLRLHPEGPCKQCVPVIRFPRGLFPGGDDPGPCRCGLADRVDPHIAESRSSRSSGTRSVAFSDDHSADDHDAPGGGAIKKSSRSILKKPRSLDTTRSKAHKAAAPKLPYPQRTQSVPDWSAAQLPSPRQTQGSQSASSARSGASLSLPLRQLSHDVSVPIIAVQKSCCGDFDELKGVCACVGKCEDHWCCEHWQLDGRCLCKGACHVPCCTHQQEGSRCCNCAESCLQHTAKKCCICGFKPGVVPNVCACDSTCRDHAVCEHFRSFKPQELACMAGCDAFKKDQKCEHKGSCRQSPCDAHPCCAHHVYEDNRAYCGCGKTCPLHVCCSHYLPGFKTCECNGTCKDHLPVIPKPLRQHFRDVTAVAEAQTTPPTLAADLYYPGWKLLPRQDGQPYDWNQVVQVNMALVKSHGLLGPNGEIMVPGGAVGSVRPAKLEQRPGAQNLQTLVTILGSNASAEVSSRGSPRADDRQTVRVPIQASRNASDTLATSSVPSAPPGAYQASLRSGRGSSSSNPFASRDRFVAAGRSSQNQDVRDAVDESPIPQDQPNLRDIALPDFPQPDTGRLLSDSLLDFRGPQPNFFDHDENEDDIGRTFVSPRHAARAGGYAGCGRNCRCRCQGDEYHMLTGPGSRFAYYTCRRMHGGGAERPAVTDDENSILDSSNVSQGRRSEAQSRQSSLQNSQGAGSQEESRQASQGVGSQIRSRLGSQSATSRQGSQGVASQPGTGQGSGQGSRQGSQSESRQGSQGAVSQVGSRQGSQDAGSETGSRQGSQDTTSQIGSRRDSQQGSRRGSARSGLGGANDHGSEDQEPERQQPEGHQAEGQQAEDQPVEGPQPEGEQIDEPQPEEQRPGEQRPDERQPEEQRPEEQRPNDLGPEGVQPQGQAERQAEGQQPEEQQPNNGGPGDGAPNDNDPDDSDGGGGGRRPRRRQPDIRPPPSPWRQIWDFILFLIGFLTWDQAINLYEILSFAYAFTIFNVQHVLHFLRLARRWQRRPNPHLPGVNIITFLLWLMLMWQLTMMIALGEERRLWLEANPRTAAYLRGMQFRNPYPRWRMFQVDYALLEPALGGVSASLHRLYFRPGLLRSVKDAISAVVAAWQSMMQATAYSRVEEAVVHARAMARDAGIAIVKFTLGTVAVVWAFMIRLVSSWPGVPWRQPGNTGDTRHTVTPVIPVHPPGVSNPQEVYDGPSWWDVWWEYFCDLVVRTVTGRRKVPHV